MLKKAKTNAKYKDTVFTALFSDEAKLLELYNAIEGTNYKDKSLIKINTLPDVLYLNQRNDISFTIDDKVVVLIEHQSTINPNMPMRLLLYIARVYEHIIENKAMYKSTLVKIPRPEFIVLYNGVEKYPKEGILKLSSAFEKVKSPAPKNTLELSARVININWGCNKEFEQKSKTLSGYSLFIAKVRDFERKGLVLADAIKSAVDFCVKHNALKEFLTNKSSEVENMLLTEFNMKDAQAVWKEEGRMEGKAEGKAEGRMEGKMEGIEEGIAKGMAKERNFFLELLNKGLSAEAIKKRLASGKTKLAY